MPKKSATARLIELDQSFGRYDTKIGRILKKCMMIEPDKTSTIIYTIAAPSLGDEFFRVPIYRRFDLVDIETNQRHLFKIAIVMTKPSDARSHDLCCDESTMQRFFKCGKKISGVHVFNYEDDTLRYHFSFVTCQILSKFVWKYYKTQIDTLICYLQT